MSQACQMEDQIVELYEDALPESETRALELHAETCVHCQDVLQTLRNLDAALGESEALSDAFMQRLLAVPDTAGSTCEMEDQLVQLFEEALSEPETRALELHTETCSRCQDVLKTLGNLDEALETPEVPSNDFMEALLALPDTTPTRQPLGRVLVWTGAAAAILVVALLVRDRVDSPARKTTPPTPVVSDEQPDRSTAAVTPTLPPEVDVRESALVDPTLPTLHRLARGADLERARLAIAQLGRNRRRESLPVLLEVVRMTDRRAAAVHALGALADPRAVRALEPLLQDAQVASIVREAIVRVGGTGAALALARAVEATEDPAQVALLIDALARADGGLGIRRLGQILEAQDAARVAAARSAIRRHEERLLPSALKELERAPGSEIVHVLAVVDVLTPPTAVPALRRLFEKRAHRARTAQSLALIDTAESAKALWQALPAPEARAAFRRGGRGVERWLLERLEDGSRRSKRLAIDLLGLCGSPTAVPSLVARIDDKTLAPGVLLSLGRIGGESAVEALASLSKRPALRRRAMDALGRTGSPLAVAELERLGRETRSLRATAQQALATIPCGEAVEAIVRLDGGSYGGRSTERALRVMDRDLVLATLDTLVDKDLAATVRRIRGAMGGSVSSDAPRVALN